MFKHLSLFNGLEADSAATIAQPDFKEKAGKRMGAISIKRALALAILIFFSGCRRDLMVVQSDYVTIENLSSYYIGTPDPRLNHPPIGQRIVINWKVPKHWVRTQNLHVEAVIRFRNREQIIKIFPVDKFSGTYIFELLGEDYCRTGGVLAYRVDLIGDCGILEEWRHQLWADLITIEP